MNIQSLHFSSFSLSSPAWKSFWNSCLWDSAVGLKTGMAQSMLRLRCAGEQGCGRTILVCLTGTGTEHCSWVTGYIWTCCGSEPMSYGYQRTGVAIYNLSFPLEICLAFVSHYLPRCFSTFRFSFRQICHWSLKCSVDFKTRFPPVQ